MVDIISEWIRMCQHQLQLRSLSLSHNILTSPSHSSSLASSRKTFEKYDNHRIVCNIVQPHTYLFRVQSCWARHILGFRTEHFVFRHGFSFQLGSKTIFRGQLHPAQNVIEPVPTRRHATHSTALSTSRSLPHEYLHLCYPKLDIFGISTNSESLFLKCSLFSTEFFCLRHKSVIVWGQHKVLSVG